MKRDTRFKPGHEISRGEANARAKLTPTSVREIRRLRDGLGRRSLPSDDPRSLVAIAERYGISVTTVSHIAMRRRWRHVA